MASCSVNTKPNPPAAREPSSMRWKSESRPSGDARYIVIGDMTIRLRSVTPLSLKALNRSAMTWCLDEKSGAPKLLDVYDLTLADRGRDLGVSPESPCGNHRPPGR